MKKEERGIMLIPLIITIIILLILVGIIISLNLGDNGLFNISKIMEKNKLAETEEEKEEPILSYKLYDNTGEKLEILVAIKKEEGIQSIEYTDENGKDVLLHCNDKQTVGIDINVETNIDYTFKIISNDIEYIETINIPDNYIENYISKPEFLNDESSETVYKYNVVYNTDLDESEGVTYYYKIGKDSTNWTEYTGNISVNINNYDNVGNTTTTLLTKQVDSLGDTILRKDIIDIPAKGNLDVFAAIISSVGTLNRGISVSYSNAESSRFEAYHLGVGHSSYFGNFSATYTMQASTFPDNLIAEQLYINYNLIANTVRGYSSSIGASATIYYTDGTTTTQSISNQTYNSYTSVPITLSINQNKKINYVVMKISGYDNNYSYAYGYINSILFKNASFISTEE